MLLTTRRCHQNGPVPEDGPNGRCPPRSRSRTLGHDQRTRRRGHGPKMGRSTRPLLDEVRSAPGRGSWTSAAAPGACSAGGPAGRRGRGVDRRTVRRHRRDRVPRPTWRSVTWGHCPTRTTRSTPSGHAFPFAADPANALREAARVGRPGAPVVIATWGRPDQCEAAAYLSGVGALLPGAARPFALAEEGRRRGVRRAGGLSPGKPSRGPVHLDVPRRGRRCWQPLRHRPRRRSRRRHRCRRRRHRAGHRTR